MVSHSNQLSTFGVVGVVKDGEPKWGPHLFVCGVDMFAARFGVRNSRQNRLDDFRLRLAGGIMKRHPTEYPAGKNVGPIIRLER